jgi:hypothetical protein
MTIFSTIYVGLIAASFIAGSFKPLSRSRGRNPLRTCNSPHYGTTLIHIVAPGKSLEREADKPSK